MRRLIFCLLVLCSALVEASPPRERMLNVLAGDWVARAIYTSVKLGIAESLEECPKTSEELAQEVCANEDSMERLLRLLASQGIFERSGEGLYSNNEMSRLLSANHPSSLSDLIQFYGEELHQAFDPLPTSVVLGKSAFELEFGQPVFAYFKSHPDRALLFQKAMQEKSKAVISASLVAYDFSRFHTLCDVGGGFGHFLLALMQTSPALVGTLFDLPDVVDKVNPAIHRVAGDFFKEVPAGQDAYLLKSVIHDWDDEKAVAILRNCHDAMRNDSKLLIVDVVLLPDGSSRYAYCMDLLMMAITGGKERTLADFDRILQQAGFRMNKVYPTSTEFSMIEAVKSE